LWDDGRDGDTYFLRLAGVGVSLHCQGQGFGSEAIEMALRAAVDRAFGAGLAVASISGLVHTKNYASQQMCSAGGLVNLGTSSANTDYEVWATELELPFEFREN
jgi:LDH2 family malate/lactate/ureidoglycolate dehydrogenase